MRPALTLLLVVFLLSCAAAQSYPDLPGLETARLAHQQRAMLVLGGWAVGNIGVGLALRGNTEGSTRRFHEMNAIWNVVNLGIAGLGYFTLGGPETEVLSGWGENVSFEKILLFNAGLDVGYVLGGLYLRERARRPDADTDRLRGYGNSIVLQGGFLFVFDLVNYFIAQGRDEPYRLLLGGTSDGIGLMLSF